MAEIKVTVDEASGAERSIRKFKRMCDSYGIVKVYRSKQEYKKPSIPVAKLYNEHNKIS